jgi:hypothetical protein
VPSHGAGDLRPALSSRAWRWSGRTIRSTAGVVPTEVDAVPDPQPLEVILDAVEVVAVVERCQRGLDPRHALGLELLQGLPGRAHGEAAQAQAGLDGLAEGDREQRVDTGEHAGAAARGRRRRPRRSARATATISSGTRFAAPTMTPVAPSSSALKL